MVNIFKISKPYKFIYYYLFLFFYLKFFLKVNKDNKKNSYKSNRARYLQAREKREAVYIEQLKKKIQQARYELSLKRSENMIIKLEYDIQKSNGELINN